MSASLQLVVLIAAACSALAFLAVKVIVPLAKGITTFNEDVVPNVQYLPLLADLKPVLSVLEAIAAEFRSDSGSTLKDATNRLEDQAETNREAADRFARAAKASIAEIQVAMEVVKQLAKTDRDLAREDREALRDMVRALQRNAQVGARLELAGELAKEDRATVASDLAQAQRRADDVGDVDAPGAAADAASQSEPDDPQHTGSEHNG